MMRRIWNMIVALPAALLALLILFVMAAVFGFCLGLVAAPVAAVAALTVGASSPSDVAAVAFCVVGVLATAVRFIWLVAKALAAIRDRLNAIRIEEALK